MNYARHRNYQRGGGVVRDNATTERTPAAVAPGVNNGRPVDERGRSTDADGPSVSTRKRTPPPTTGRPITDGRSARLNSRTAAKHPDDHPGAATSGNDTAAVSPWYYYYGTTSNGGGGGSTNGTTDSNGRRWKWWPAANRRLEL